MTTTTEAYTTTADVTTTATVETTLEVITPTTTEVIPNVIVTLLLISGCGFIAVMVAKLADYIYDRHIEKHSASKVSERAKKTLQTRSIVMALKVEPTEESARIAKSAARKWIRKASKTSSVVTINEISDHLKVDGPAGMSNGSCGHEGNPTVNAWSDNGALPANGGVKGEVSAVKEIPKKDLANEPSPANPLPAAAMGSPVTSIGKARLLTPLAGNKTPKIP